MIHQEIPSDPRTLRTRQLLRDTLIELTLERGFSSVTVRDIARRAMVNRATFYRHYEDKYQVVTSYIIELLAPIQPPHYPTPLINNRTIPTISKSALWQFYTQIDVYRDFWRIMFSSRGMPSLEVYLQRYVKQNIRTWFERNHLDTYHTEPLFLFRVHHCAQTFATGMIWWIENKDVCSVEEIVDWIVALLVGGMHAHSIE